MKRTRMIIGKSFIVLSGMVFAGAFLCGCGSQRNEQKEQNDYEEIYSAKLELEGNKIPLEVWTDKNMSANGIIKINGQEIALIAAGGASGSVCAVQVFSNENSF